MLTLIDVSGWVHRYFHVVPAMVRSDGVHINAVHGCTGGLWRLLRTNPGHVCAVMDAGRRTFRHDLYPDYKAHRPPLAQELRDQFPLIRQAISAFGVQIIDAEGFEADDVIATYVRLALEQGMDVRIISSDKDLKQLITPEDEPGARCFMLDPLTNNVIDAASVVARYGVQPDRLGDVLALMGDAVDNVPGVPAVGEKTAGKLVAQYGSLEGVLEAAQDPTEYMGKKVKSNLNLFANEARLSRALVQLRSDVPVPFDLASLELKTPDSNTVAAFLREMQLVSLHEEIFGQVAA